MEARIISIDQFGVVKLRFYDSKELPLKDKIQVKNFNKDHISIEVGPAAMRLQDPTFDPSILEISSWEFVNYEKMTATFVLNFTLPL